MNEAYTLLFTELFKIIGSIFNPSAAEARRKLKFDILERRAITYADRIIKFYDLWVDANDSKTSNRMKLEFIKNIKRYQKIRELI